MDVETLDWTRLRTVAALPDEILPVAVQDHHSGAVIMVGYMNRQALHATLETGEAFFWSTARNELHRKGETSGDVLEVVDVKVNCDLNSLLVEVRLRGEGACHTKDEDGRARGSCFYRSLTDSSPSWVRGR